MSKVIDFPALYQLADGSQIPQLGYGTYKLLGQSGRTSIIDAYQQGYRCFDTAVKYNNEALFGQIFDEGSLKPKDLLLISKLPGTHHQREQVPVCLRESLKRIGVPQLDFYLMHWPNPASGDGYRQAWKGLLDCREAGLVKQVAVANFTRETLEVIYQDTGEWPVLNQVECHPAFAQAELLKYLQDREILLQAWSPLGKNQALYDHPTIMAIAKQVQKTPAQVILRWHLERGCMPLPKAAQSTHIAENIDIFDFSLEEGQIQAITGLSRPDGRLFGADPNSYIEI